MLRKALVVLLVGGAAAAALGTSSRVERSVVPVGESIRIVVREGKLTARPRLFKDVLRVTARMPNATEQVNLGYDFDAEPIFANAYVVIGGLLPQGIDAVRLRIDGLGTLEATTSRRGWLVLAEKERALGRAVDATFMSDGAAAYHLQYPDLLPFFDTVHAYGPLSQ